MKQKGEEGMGKHTCASCGGNCECSGCHGKGYTIGTLGGKTTCGKCGGKKKCGICKGTGYVHA